MLKKSSKKSLQRLKAFQSSSSLRIKSLPRISSHYTINNLNKQQHRNSSTVKHLVPIDKTAPSASENSVSYSLDDEMNRLNSLALRNQNKHRDWLGIQQKIIEMNHSLHCKENTFCLKPLNIGKFIDRFSARTVLGPRDLNFE